METHEPPSKAVTEHERNSHGGEGYKSVAETVEGADVAGKMTELKARDIKRPRRTRSKRPEHVLPSAAFTFDRPIWSRDLDVDKAARMPDISADNTKQFPKTMAERPKYMLPAFKFELPTYVHRLLFESPTGEDQDVDHAVNTARLPASVELHSPRSLPQFTEHEVPITTFTFTSPIWDPQSKARLGLPQREGTDLAAEMAELQVSVAKQPPETAPERSGHVLPNAAFTFTAATQSHEPGSTSDTKFVTTRPTDAQDAAAKTLPLRQQHGLPKTRFSFTTPIRSGVPGSTSGVESDVNHSTKTLEAGSLDKRDLLADHGTQTTASRHIEARAKKFSDILLTFTLTRILKKNPSDFMGPFYDFTDPPRNARSLKYLSREFWQVLDQCCEVNAACKMLETELHGGRERERRGWLNRDMDDHPRRLPIEQVLKRITNGPQEDTEEVDAQPVIRSEDLYEVARPGMRSEKQLRGLIEKACSERTKHEVKLNTIAWDAIVQLGEIPSSLIAALS